MKQILEMIEQVSPDDTEMLDEIDSEVGEFLTGVYYVEREHDRIVINVTDPKTGSAVPYTHERYPQYTRSRDALKAIRPEGWDILCGYSEHYNTKNKELRSGYSCSIFQRNTDLYFTSPTTIDGLPIEELAELHAIIQAIEFERSKA